MPLCLQRQAWLQLHARLQKRMLAGAAATDCLPFGTNSMLNASSCTKYAATANACRYVNTNATRQNNNLSHYAHLVVDVDAVMKLVKAMLRVQQAAMTRYSFDDNV